MLFTFAQGVGVDIESATFEKLCALEGSKLGSKNLGLEQRGIRIRILVPGKPKFECIVELECRGVNLNKSG